jgi:DNA-binding MarR family transcriptional regulator
MLLIEPTEAGRQTANSFRPIVHQNQKMWVEGLSDAEQERLIAALHELQATLMEKEG